MINQKISTILCQAVGYTKEEVHDTVIKELKAHYKENTYNLKYIRVLDIADVDKEVIERQNEIFEKHNDVWILNCCYNKK